MKAKLVLDSGKIIDAEIFAYIWTQKSNVAVYFDSETQKLNTLRERNEIKCFIVDVGTADDWVKVNNDVEGFNWVLPYLKIENETVTILDGYDIEKCRRLQQAVKIPTWHEIKTQTDCKSVVSAGFDFHDSHVSTLKKQGNKMKIVFDDSGWGFKIEFELEGDIETNLVLNFGAGGLNRPDYYDLIFCSSMFIENGAIYWVDDENINSLNDLKGEYFYFKANKVKWKLIIVKEKK